jgi:deoxyribonuclease V
MNLDSIPTWVKTVEEAKKIQEELRFKVIQEDQLSEVNYVAGVDVGFKKTILLLKQQ